jgi:hypothetical protein
MAKRHSRNKLTPAVMLLGRVLAGLMVFMQVAAAAGPCVDSSGCGGSAAQMGAHDGHRDHGRVDQICGSSVVAADQVSVADPISHVPDLGPASTFVAFVAAPEKLPARRSKGALPSAHISQFLLLHRLQL